MRKTLGFALTAALSLPWASFAQTAPNTNRPALSGGQLAVLDGRAAQQYSNSERLQPPRSEIPPELRVVPAYRGSYAGPYLALAKDAARKNNIPEDLFLRLVQRESGWNPVAVSNKGALGLAQLMPDTARLLGVNAMDPIQNLNGGAKYLRMQYDKFGSWNLALAAYNAGPGAVEQYGGIPPFAETQAYVAVILGG